MADWVLAAERAYVAAAFADAAAAIAAATPDRAHAAAAAAAIASRFLAVGTPRSFAIVIDAPGDAAAAALALTAHRTWFAPRDIRCASTAGDTAAAQLAGATGGRLVSLDEALASDIVNLYGAHAPLSPSRLRRGTHVNIIGDTPLAAELHQLAMVVPEAGLAALAAGLVDGRQLDELTIFVYRGAIVE